ncbi:anti-sigma factor [Cryomorphaceae bacterium 1068]|nr:anti-sigma factor [Cryomorphaceae bacterium 1068]
MDVKAYIESGILEQFALGDVSEQERQEIECLSKIYPEIKAALEGAELDLEMLAQAGAVKAPSGIKASIMAELSNHDQLPPSAEEKSTRVEEEVVAVPFKSSSTWPVVWAAAASITLLLAFWQFVERGNAETELAAAKEEQEQLLANNEYLRGEVEYLSEDVQDTFDPSFKKIVLESTKVEGSTGVSVLWQKESGKVKINLASLPELPTDKQYQLWVLKDGVPSDMGVLPKDFQDVYLADSQTNDGDAFAITIEPLGGLENPTLDQLVYLGTV